MYTEIQKNNKTYLHNPQDDGYYGVRVEPSSPEDNTSGKVGIHWEYLQYAPPSELVIELRSLIPEFRALETVREEEIEKKLSEKLNAEEKHYKYLRKLGLCPHCHTFCDGDCRS